MRHMNAATPWPPTACRVAYHIGMALTTRGEPSTATVVFSITCEAVASGPSKTSR